MGAGISPLLARLYALRGVFEDGRRRDAPVISAELAPWLPQAEALLAQDRALPSHHQPSVTASGRCSVFSTAHAPTTGALTPAPTVSTGPAPTSVVAVQQHLFASHTRIAYAITGTALTQCVVAENTWAALPYRPDQLGFQPVTLHDISVSGHALCIYAADFASVRVNGGLVVPGRFYAIGSGLRIRSSIALQILIRPLSAVASYYQTPAYLPYADG
jgi:hypothetical protein